MKAETMLRFRSVEHFVGLEHQERLHGAAADDGHRDGEAVGQRCRGSKRVSHLRLIERVADERLDDGVGSGHVENLASGVDEGRFGAPHDQHRRAVTREPRGGRAADAAAPSRHQRGLSGQRLLRHVSLPSLGTVRRTSRPAPGSHTEAVPSSAGARPGSRRGPACAGS